MASASRLVVMTVMPGELTMGKSLVLWFLYSAVISAFAACIAFRGLPPGAPYMSVFKWVAVTAFLGYAAALWQMWIWYHRSLGTTIRATIGSKPRPPN